MLANYLTLYHISKLLDHRYAQTVIAEIYSQSKNTLSLVLYTPEPHTITISCNARNNYILARAGDTRTDKNTVDLFPALIDSHIESVYISSSDRIIYMKLSGNRRLCIEMFASQANVVLCSEEGTIVDAFLKRKDLIDTTRIIQTADVGITVENILVDKAAMVEEFQTSESTKTNPVQLLKTLAPKLGKILAEEIVHRTNSLSHQNLQQYTENIFNTSSAVIQQIANAKSIAPVIYFEDRSPICFSLIPLETHSSFRNESYDDLFFGIQKFISFERSSSSFIQQKKKITQWLGKEIEKAERTIRALETEQAESSRAEQYELFANLIMAHLPSLKKGLQTAELTNSFTDNSIVSIPMDRALSPQKNAEKYFEKSKKSKIGREGSKERLHLLKKRLSSLTVFFVKSNDIKEGISLKNFIQSYGGMIKALGYMTEKEQEELPPFKIFTVHGGFTVFAGKSSANNDLLTFRYSKPNDLWFHARGSSGSHVVLKIGSAEGIPSKQAIDQAASIAAYYSKMKNAKHVPVAMTERKYIHKPKGAPAGSVALDKEKVIFVSPILPDIKV